MEILYIKPQGFCMGVKRALTILDNVIEKYSDKKIYVLGEIIHNNYIIDKYEKKGIEFLKESMHVSKEEQLTNIKNCVVVFQAHGSSSTCYQIVKDNNNILIDATCPIVLKIHSILSKKINTNKVFYIGRKNHPETISALSIGNVTLIENKEDLYKYNIDNTSFFTNQTTLSLFQIDEIYNEALKINKNIIINNSLCLATTNRQKAIIDNKNNVDCFIIVGDKMSSNCTRLYEIASLYKPSYFINSINELNIDDIKKFKRIGISSGASTPDDIVQDVMLKIKKYFGII